ncbi:hypothetical protein AKJ16_DCAP03883 [Drosera capensis]
MNRPYQLKRDVRLFKEDKHIQNGAQFKWLAAYSSRVHQSIGVELRVENLADDEDIELRFLTKGTKDCTTSVISGRYSSALAQSRAILNRDPQSNGRG